MEPLSCRVAPLGFSMLRLPRSRTSTKPVCGAALRSGLQTPARRGEERLLSKHLREQPPPPPAVDPEGLIEETSEAVCNALHDSSHIIIATDGSAKSGIAGFSDVVNDPLVHFAGGDGAEDQSLFRAEVCALRLALSAVLRAAHAGSVGHVAVIVDCSAALLARFHCPSLPLLGDQLGRLTVRSITLR